jgi:MFS transporter, PAT family, beta-lactamase induction signal transducer AmpG
MALCWKPVAAVQFALFMAISNIGAMVGAALTGPLVVSLTAAQALSAMAVVPVVATLLLLRVDVDAHVLRVSAFIGETAPTLDPPLLEPPTLAA